MARELGVAPSTVSRALNGNSAISEQMTQRIKELAHRSNYVPNQMAVNLKSGRNNTIGVIVPMIGRSFFASVIEGIEDYASVRGYDVLICQSKDSEQRERRLIHSISGRVDGVIASFGAHNQSHAFYNDLGVPLVMFDRIDRSLRAASVTVDDRGGARMAVQHLLDQGFRRIYHFAGPRHVSIWHDRHEGYLDAMRHAEVSIEESWVWEAPTVQEQGVAFVQQILQAGDPLPDAIFCSGDYAALGVMTAMKEAGIDMPVVGFANEPFCQVVEPQLTSVNQFSSKIGTMACQSLLDILNGEPGVNTVISPELIVRSSSLKREKPTRKKQKQ